MSDLVNNHPNYINFNKKRKVHPMWSSVMCFDFPVQDPGSEKVIFIAGFLYLNAVVEGKNLIWCWLRIFEFGPFFVLELDSTDSTTGCGWFWYGVPFLWHNLEQSSTLSVLPNTLHKITQNGLFDLYIQALKGGSSVYSLICSWNNREKSKTKSELIKWNIWINLYLLLNFQCILFLT